MTSKLCATVTADTTAELRRRRDLVTDAETVTPGGGCCGAPAPTVTVPAGRGLATGVAGGLLTSPVQLITLGEKPAGEQTGSCC